METLSCKTFPKGIEPREIKVIGNQMYYPSFLLNPDNKGLFNNFDYDSRVIVKGICHYLISKPLKKGVDYIN